VASQSKVILLLIATIYGAAGCAPGGIHAFENRVHPLRTTRRKAMAALCEHPLRARAARGNAATVSQIRLHTHSLPLATQRKFL
jgi:hypothetical protein